MNKTINRTMVVTLVIMLMLLFAGVGSANSDSASITEKERLELANKLWGTDITYGEYIEQLFPEAYDKSPDATTKSYYDMEVSWINPAAEGPDSKQTFTATTGQTRSVYFGVANSELDYDGSEITYKTWQRMVLPTPYTKIPSMSVLTHLWRDDGEEEIVGIELESENNVYELEAEDTYDYSSSAYYRVIGQYSGVYPSGVTPPSFNGISSTDWEYVS
ncbi:hypothetical protein [Methanohalophilus sp. RSK]|uniref:hypothetical protein n=1 Tax=Methanohalophilus sp. RSK TaxID=2485783 RepID=UPI0011CE4C12|nr:hypothetical protein [Methanohalophilus sp. RSK]